MFDLQIMLPRPLYDFIYEKRIVELVVYNLVNYSPHRRNFRGVRYEDFSRMFDYSLIPNEYTFWDEKNTEYYRYLKNYKPNFKFLQ